MATSTLHRVKAADQQTCKHVFEIIRECANWLKEKHEISTWVDYYTFENVEEMIRAYDTDIYYFENSPVMTATTYVSPTPPLPLIKAILKNQSGFKVKEKTLFLTAFCVRPGHHGQGFAKKYIQELIADCKTKNIGRIMLISIKAYKELTGFYLKRGFEIMGSFHDEKTKDHYNIFLKNLN